MNCTHMKKSAKMEVSASELIACSLFMIDVLSVLLLLIYSEIIQVQKTSGSMFHMKAHKKRGETLIV